MISAGARDRVETRVTKSEPPPTPVSTVDATALEVTENGGHRDGGGNGHGITTEERASSKSEGMPILQKLKR